ncbi:MAG: class I tRNA ligase family protein [Bdellovibrionaceae bacterium]|nr:class I tRNA ligase family protein [Pseudobdellovibrionaceae bacterium]
MLKNKNFYISTPLYYVNDKPHLGTAYTSIIADILNRYQKLFGYSSFFITGTDEHGQKCEQSALNRGLSPQEHCDQMSPQFKKTWKILNIEYDLFFRTTFDYHCKAVQNVLQNLYDKGDIYSSHYKGWYCVSEEIFYTEKDLVGAKSAEGKELIPLEEKAWFFKMSKYQKALQNHLDNHPDFIKPKERYNEIQGFLKQPLQDLCVSRPKKRVSWGIELPFDNNCVAYVWVDALLNYVTGAGYLNKKEHFEKYWLNAKKHHLIGKDILMTHAVYWPCFLMALNLPLPDKIFAHGWLLNKEDEKMSKSKGDKLDPLELIELVGLDELRWFLAKEIVLGKDSALSVDLITQKVNEDLADNFGNIFSRISRLIEKHFDGQIPYHTEDSLLKKLTEEKQSLFKNKIDNFELSQALHLLSSLLVEVNKYLEQTAPWKLVKIDKKQAGVVLYNCLEVLRICGILLAPVMPKKMEKFLSALGEEVIFKNTKWGRQALGKALKHSSGLFPKILI